MATRHKDFGSDGKITDYTPISFTIFDETFQCVPALQGLAILDFAGRAGSEDGIEASKALFNFFKQCMVETEYERFLEFSNDPVRIIPIEKLGDIVQWLIGEYTQRPTQPADSSSAGTESVGLTSTAAPLPQESVSGI